MNNKLLVGLSILLLGCNSTLEDPAPEDYEALFPFTGIEKPKISYEDMEHQQCNINNYVYPGVEGRETARKYMVTLKCKYNIGRNKMAVPQFFVKYVGLDKNLKVIGSNSQVAGLSELLKDGEEKTIIFELPSGYPMYLSISGKGDTDSHIEATVKAVSNDGVVIVPELTYAITQNMRGINEIIPYCEYIVLP